MSELQAVVHTVPPLPPPPPHIHTHACARAVSELQAVVQALAAACVEAYCRGHYSPLGVAAREQLPREWLSTLLVAPFLRAAAK